MSTRYFPWFIRIGAVAVLLGAVSVSLGVAMALVDTP